MREPTPSVAIYSWWNEALAGLKPPVYEDEPQCGLFKRRIQARGPFVPARIYLERTVCEDTGELLSDEILRCEVHGEQRDPNAEWLWLAKHPISTEEHEDLTIIAREMTYV